MWACGRRLRPCCEKFPGNWPSSPSSLMSFRDFLLQPKAWGQTEMSPLLPTQRPLNISWATACLSQLRDQSWYLRHPELVHPECASQTPGRM